MGNKTEYELHIICNEISEFWIFSNLVTYTVYCTLSARTYTRTHTLIYKYIYTQYLWGERGAGGGGVGVYLLLFIIIIKINSKYHENFLMKSLPKSSTIWFYIFGEFPLTYLRPKEFGLYNKLKFNICTIAKFPVSIILLRPIDHKMSGSWTLVYEKLSYNL